MVQPFDIARQVMMSSMNIGASTHQSAIDGRRVNAPSNADKRDIEPERMARLAQA